MVVGLAVVLPCLRRLDGWWINPHRYGWKCLVLAGIAWAAAGTMDLVSSGPEGPVAIEPTLELLAAFGLLVSVAVEHEQTRPAAS